MRSNLITVVTAVASVVLVASVASADQVQEQFRLMEQRMAEMEDRLESTSDDLRTARATVDEQQRHGHRRVQRKQSPLIILVIRSAHAAVEAREPRYQECYRRVDCGLCTGAAVLVGVGGCPLGAHAHWTDSQ